METTIVSSDAATPAPGPAPAPSDDIAAELAAPSPLSPLTETIDAVLAGKPYAASIRSVQLLATTVLRKAPRTDAEKVGVIRKGTRAGVRSAAPGGNGCARGRWIQLEPRGWACETTLAPSREAPTEATVVSLTGDDTDLPPAMTGVYGVVHGKSVQAYETAADAAEGTGGRTLVGAHTVRSAGTVTAGGRRYWRTTQGDLIDAASIAVIGASAFKGIALADAAPLPAWVRAQKDPRKPAITRAAPSATGAPLGTLEPRTIVSVLEESGEFARISDRAWIARADLRAARIAAPPAGTAADERWFDIDLDEQVLVAYEGKRPVYATLVSTGKTGHSTPELIARVNSKLLASDMVSRQGDRYSVAGVPWTMFYDGNYALHTSYWHDNFGGTRSHGCINLSPRDARLLYLWSSPDVPPGWTAVYGDADHPGSMVRVRSQREPDPGLRGYARAVRDRSTVVASR